MYVEDEKFLADAVKYNLEKNDIDVDHAADGEEGLEKAVSGIYDCVVLDIMLPKLSGIEVLERMREMPRPGAQKLTLGDIITLFWFSFI